MTLEYHFIVTDQSGKIYPRGRLMAGPKDEFILLIKSEILRDINLHYRGENSKFLAKKMGVSEKTLENYKTGQNINQESLKRFAYFLKDEPWPNPEQRKVIYEFLISEGNISLGENTKDPNRTLDEYLNGFSNIELPFELIVIMSSESGLSESDITTKNQWAVVKEMEALGYVEFNSITQSYKINSKFGDSFTLGQRFMNFSWPLAIKNAELKFRKEYFVQNRIEDYLILKSDIEELKSICNKFLMEVAQLEERAILKKNAEKLHLYGGLLFSPVNPEKHAKQNN